MVMPPCERRSLLSQSLKSLTELQYRLASPQNYLDTCSDLLTRMLNNVPTHVHLRPPYAPLPNRISRFTLQPTGPHSFALSGVLRLLDGIPSGANVTLLWGDSLGHPCANCSFTGLTIDTFVGNQVKVSGFPNALLLDFSVNINQTFNVFWFELMQGDQVKQTVDNSGQGYPASLDMLLVNQGPQTSWTCMVTGCTLNVTLAIAENATVSSVSAQAYQAATLDADGRMVPGTPLQLSTTLSPYSGAGQIEGWQLWFGSIFFNVSGGSDLDLSFSADVNGRSLEIPWISTKVFVDTGFIF